MISTHTAGGVYFLVLILFHALISSEAFNLHPVGLASVKTQSNVEKAEQESKGSVRLECRRRQLYDVDGNASFTNISSKTMPDRTCTPGVTNESTRATNNSWNERWSRDQFLLNCRSYLAIGFAASTGLSWSSFPSAANAKAYSENAANLARINNGDFSGGSVFNNNPTTERGKKRRAMAGCKVTLSREEASTTILKRESILSEKECNTMVLDGDTEFMLKALRILDCPTCSNGIGRVD